ncbi:sugar kinase [Streptomyces sp. DSM 40750]|uniref:sugar kinase n=1 Tax=Streptomyces sp. DSM 40750 TaxID=2801030 RepID=UPI003FA6E37E
MVTFLPTRPGRLADVPSFDRAIGGAESNVACALAAAGHSVRWVSRVGADGFGDHLVETIGGYGVDVTSVGRDPLRPTGVYFRTAGDRATDAHEVAYYRAGSAASAMSTATVDPAAVRAGRVLHLSGITAALSDDCLALLWELTEPRPGRPLVSFDVNHRPGLWPDADGTQGSRGPRVLLDLARRADLVFVGADEARAAWGLRGAAAVRDALPEPELVVVKQGKGGAVAFDKNTNADAEAEAEADMDTDTDTDMYEDTGAGMGRMEDADGTATVGPGPHVVPALHVDVVAAVGAGDAFAAGFLSATLRGLPVRTRLRHGHLMAAAALTVPGDVGTPPSRDHADRLAALDDDAWGRLRLGPGWTTQTARTTQTASRAEEEVRTP